MQIVFSANKLTQLNYPQQKNSFVSFKGVKVNEDNNSSNSSKSFVDDWREHLKNPLEVSFVEEFSKKIENIKKECDDKIRATKDSIFDFFNSKGKERARLKAEREVALATARECQEIFEKSELKVIELKKEYLKLAKELNLSKETIANFNRLQNASLKRLEIAQNRKMVDAKSGLGRLAGYEEEKNILRRTFIDLLDDERAGLFLDKNLPNAILFFGPTGCGKTSFAKAFAEEAGCKFRIMPCPGTQTQKEENFKKAILGYSKKNADGTETFCKGLLETSQEEFDNSKCRTIVLIDEFDKFFTKTTSAGFINTLKGILNNCSEKHHLTFFLTTNNLQKIPYELINSHRIGLNVNLDPPNKENAVQVIEFYFDGVDTKDLDYERITDELFSFAPTELYSNSHLEQICKIAIEQIKPINEPLDTQMFLQAIDEYNKQSDNHDLLRITEKYLSQYEEDKELV